MAESLYRVVVAAAIVFLIALAAYRFHLQRERTMDDMPRWARRQPEITREITGIIETTPSRVLVMDAVTGRACWVPRRYAEFHGRSVSLPLYLFDRTFGFLDRVYGPDPNRRRGA